MRKPIETLGGALLMMTLVLPTGAGAAPADHRRHPPAFNRDEASAIGHARQRYDRHLYDSYRGNPGAQFELRQKRQNLCRNTPEMC